jgi:hypothetical protein
VNDSLEQRLLSVIGRGAGATLSDGEFTALALPVFEHQYEGNSTYRAYCDRLEVTPAAVRHWIEIPAVPADAFKAAPLVCGDPASAAVTFRTSGTTRGSAARGEHHLPSTRLYREALARGFEHHLLPDGARLPIHSLIPTAAEVPDSSLSFMMAEVEMRFGAAGSRSYVVDGDLKVDELLDALRRAVASRQPVLLAGTSLAIVHLLDALKERGATLRLPTGSRAMDTGGFKGQAREISRTALYEGIADSLGIPAEWIVNEYGMTEMSSQFYDGFAGRAGPAEPRRYLAPPWMRSVAVDPETLEPLPLGSAGALRHVDLANLDSVSAIQTADLGRVTSEGLELFGRAPGASVRGCSIAMDELLQALAR